MHGPINVKLDNYSVTVTATNKRHVSSLLTEHSLSASEGVTQYVERSVQVLVLIAVISPIVRKCAFLCRVLVAPSHYLSAQKTLNEPVTNVFDLGNTLANLESWIIQILRIYITTNTTYETVGVTPY